MSNDESVRGSGSGSGSTMSSAAATPETGAPASLPHETATAATLLSPPGLLGYKEAFDLAMPATQALAAQDLIGITVDVPSAITTAVGALPGILAFREQARALAGFDISAFDLLETYTLATGHAHTNYMAASAPPEAILQLNGRGMELRQTLYTDALALARRHLISGERIAEFKANIGYKNLAFDLMALAGLLRQSWDAIASRTALTLSSSTRPTRLANSSCRRWQRASRRRLRWRKSPYNGNATSPCSRMPTIRRAVPSVFCAGTRGIWTRSRRRFTPGAAVLIARPTQLSRPRRARRSTRAAG